MVLLAVMQVKAYDFGKDVGTIGKAEATSPCDNPIASGTTGDLDWILCPDGTLTISGEGAMPDYDYPDFAPWYSFRSSIATVKIGNGITSIGSNAFFFCSNLTSITIPDDVTGIGHHAFAECSSLASITIPNDVTTIGMQSFMRCSSLTSITIPNNVASIETNAFFFCSNLQSITVEWLIPLSISADVFLGVNKLNCTLNVPEGSLEAYQAADVWKNFFNNSEYEIDENDVLVGYYGTGGDVVIPDTLGIITIGGSAFRNNINITSIVIPESVISIGEVAFAQCYGLTSITIPEGVTNIGEWAFSYCTDLTSIEVQWDTPLSVNVNVFDGITLGNLTLTVPTETKSLYEAADVWKDFGTIVEKGSSTTIAVTGISLDKETLSVEVGKTSQLTATVLPANATNKTFIWGTSDEAIATVSTSGLVSGVSEGSATISVKTEEGNFEDSCVVTIMAATNSDFEVVDGVLVAYHGAGGDVVIPSDLGITAIGEAVFQNDSTITSVTIPEGVISIRDNAFAECFSLASITISNSVTSIGYWAFGNCISLASISIPNSVESIGGYAFYACRNLSSLITIPASVTYIGDGAFFAIENLTDISVVAGNTAYSDVNGVLFNSEQTLLHTYPCGKQGGYTIPESVTNISYHAFRGCFNLSSIDIPTGVTSIENETFFYCSGLQEVTVHWNNPLVINPNVFEGVGIENCTLHIPFDTQELYEAADVWKDFGTIVEATVAVTGVSLDKTTLDLLVDATGQLTATVLPENATNQNVNWISDNDSIATVSTTGLITAKAAGIATIIVTTEDGNKTDTCTVTVTRPLSSDATLSNIEVNQGTLTPAFTPNTTAYTVSVGNAVTSITITAVKNQSAASVSGDGEKSLNVGTNPFDIVVTAEDGTQNTYTVTVTRSAPEIIAVTGVSLNKATLDLLVDSTEQLTAAVLPDNATNQKVNWRSDDESVATVSNTGLVTAKAAGKATITVTTEDGNKTAICIVTVEKKEEQAVIIEEGNPAGANGTGSINFALTIPTNASFEGSFTIEFPAGFILDVIQTVLNSDLLASYDLTISKIADGKWLFSITPKELRSAKEMVYSNILDIVYTIAEGTEDGLYEVEISDLEFNFSDGTVITIDDMTVPVTVDHNYVGINNVNQNKSVIVSVKDAKLTINSPVSEKITIYSITGIVLYHNEKPVGESYFNIGNIRDKVLIVKGGSSWVRKVIK
ncbi:hypothetical protein FACS189440_16160 [Bacteroidia bacterium]|nr:hypothetical protein FACS189440_16160 [Bacteroidia bacterium]